VTYKTHYVVKLLVHYRVKKPLTDISPAEALRSCLYYYFAVFKQKRHGKQP
jgi:hypothetical protein